MLGWAEGGPRLTNLVQLMEASPFPSLQPRPLEMGLIRTTPTPHKQTNMEPTAVLPEPSKKQQPGFSAKGGLCSEAGWSSGKPVAHVGLRSLRTVRGGLTWASLVGADTERAWIGARGGPLETQPLVPWGGLSAGGRPVGAPSSQAWRETQRSTFSDSDISFCEGGQKGFRLFTVKYRGVFL